jgi:hypothetical protein
MSPISSREYAMKYRCVSARGSAAVADSTKLLRRPNEAENSTRCRSMRRWLLGQRTALQSTAGTFQLLENLSLVTGAHTMNLGMDLRWIRSDSVGAQFARGIFNFNGRFTRLLVIPSRKSAKLDPVNSARFSWAIFASAITCSTSRMTGESAPV